MKTPAEIAAAYAADRAARRCAIHDVLLDVWDECDLCVADAEIEEARWAAELEGGDRDGDLS